MTLTEARKILLRHQAGIQVNPDSFHEAIDIAIKVLPNQQERPSTEERLATIRGLIRDAKGFDPFLTKTRDATIVCWRQLVWLKLTQEGYKMTHLAKASGFNHATIGWGVGRVRDYLMAGDHIAVKAWEQLNTILQ